MYDELYVVLTLHLFNLQMKTLEAIAKTRHHGAFQSKLARELGVEYKNFFFVINVRTMSWTFRKEPIPDIM